MAPMDARATIPASLDSSSRNKIDKLKDAKPDDFSSDFDSMQVNAHKDAVSPSSATPRAAKTRN
jgi:putative membrane protein